MDIHQHRDKNSKTLTNRANVNTKSTLINKRRKRKARAVTDKVLIF